MFMTYHTMFPERVVSNQEHAHSKDDEPVYLTTKWFVACCENCGNPIFEYNRYYRAHVHCQDVYLCSKCCIEM